MASLFSQLFSKKPSRPAVDVKKILKHKRRLDAFISRAAPERPIEKLNRVDRAILLLAVWEMAIEKNVPPKVTIDEAVELAKKYGAESSPGFVNGVLGTILRNIDRYGRSLDRKKSKIA